MSLVDRNVITLEDLSNEEIEVVFSVADEMNQSLRGQGNLCQGYVMATLFYEPSTRTRLSFETAMNRLGGRVISVSDMQTSSHAKGESLADTARVVGSYADIIVIRHPWEGAAKIAADYSAVPVINAGDGGHEHPTQTLCDLYTLREERGSLRGLTVALWGDLKYGRTVHSLAYGLARFGADIVSLPAEGLEMPAYVSERLQYEYKCYMEKGKASDIGHMMGHLDAIYVNAANPHQLSLLTQNANFNTEYDTSKTKIDALYLTRIQQERHTQSDENVQAKQDPPVVTSQLLEKNGLKDTLLMHPLPRVGELAYELDEERRSIYFKQAALGVPVRMALASLLLGIKKPDLPTEERTPSHETDYPIYKRYFGVRCPNLNCASMHEKSYITPEFKIIGTRPLRLRCVYCEQETHPQYIASSKWHQSAIDHKKYHRCDSFFPDHIKPENLIIFDSEDEAQAHGFRPSKHTALR